MHDSALVLVELGAILLGLAILARLAARLGLSPIPLYLLAGLSIGEGGVLPVVTSEEFIEIGASIGVVLLLFLLGLEYSARELMGELRRGAPSGVVDLLLNFVPGVVFGLALGWDAVAVVAMGGVTYISSSGIIAKLLSDFGWLGNRETPIVLGLLVLEDLAMAVFLPVLAVLTIGAGVGAGIASIVIAVGLVAAILLAADRYSTQISRAVFAPSQEALLLSILGVTLITAGIAEQMNVSAAVGAFLVGIAVSGEVAEQANRVLSPLRDLFAAVFFIVFGISTDPAAIPPVLLPAVVLAVITAATKVTTGWWSARRAGIGRAGQLRAGTLLVARGEFSIVIAGLAAPIAASGESLAALAATYVLIMAVAGPLTARLFGSPAEASAVAM
ncbi:MAG: cation:proton antiporter [Acidimicrobiia bacterium]